MIQIEVVKEDQNPTEFREVDDPQPPKPDYSLTAQQVNK
jgi:hypothetical protein